MILIHKQTKRSFGCGYLQLNCLSLVNFNRFGRNLLSFVTANDEGHKRVGFVDGYGIVPTSMYLLILTMLPAAIVFLFSMLLFVGNIADVYTDVVAKLRFHASVQYSESKTFHARKMKRIIVKKCRSLTPMAVKYIPVSQPICRMFARDWLQNIVDRLFDAILLF